MLQTVGKKLLYLMLLLTLSGCATARVEQGQELLVQFRCSLPNGELLAASEADPAGPRSAAWLPPKKPGPLRLIAGQPPEISKKNDREDFEPVLAVGLSLALPGMTMEQPTTVPLRARPILRPDGSQRIAQVARVWNRMKELRLTPEQYRSRKGKAAVVGDPYVIDPRVPGKVAEVDDKQVLIRFSPASSGPFSTPYGPAHLKDGGTQYEIRIEPIVGSLVRTGPMLGIISGVTERTITIDYTNPFGGAELTCSITPLPAGPVAETKGAAQP